MKKWKNFFLLAASSILLVSCEESNDILPGSAKVPAEILNDFTDRHPDAQDVEWEKEADMWEGEFEENGVEVSILYDADFNWVRTEREISVDDLPASVTEYIATNFPEGEMEEAELFESRDEGDMYIVEVEQGEKEYELFFTLDGDFIRQEVEEDDDDD